MTDGSTTPSVHPLVQRKWAELKAKSNSLRSEMVYWRTLTTDDNRPFTKHHSQVLRICGLLEGLLAGLDTELDNRNKLLGRANYVQTELLKAHTIWDFFRSKLMLRADGYVSKYLRVCDEVAWACYEPAQKLFKQALPPDAGSEALLHIKEPPFVFFNGVWSPYAVGRDQSFSVELAAGGWPVPGTPPRVMEKLPVPVIGLPWYQVSHMPDALVIEHEVGHVVESDFGLTAAMQSALQNGGTKHAPAWLSWRREIFADIYGCLAGGPSFVRSLVDFLANDVAVIQGETRIPGVWGRYPFTWLRVALAVETLSRNFAADAAVIEKNWEADYGTAAEKAEWQPDVEKVVTSLLTGPYPTLGGCRLDEVIGFPTEEGVASDVAVAGQILSGKALSDSSPRVLLSASRRLYDQSPEDFVDKGLSQRVLELMIQNIPKGTRGTAKADINAIVKAEIEFAKQRGAALFD